MNKHLHVVQSPRWETLNGRNIHTHLGKAPAQLDFTLSFILFKNLEKIRF
jgi:hypothetical protein